MLSQDMGELNRAAQFMTEKADGSDVGAAELVRFLMAIIGGSGAKWFCSMSAVKWLSCSRVPGA